MWWICTSLQLRVPGDGGEKDRLRPLVALPQVRAGEVAKHAASLQLSQLIFPQQLSLTAVPACTYTLQLSKQTLTLQLSQLAPCYQLSQLTPPNQLSNLSPFCRISPPHSFFTADTARWLLLASCHSLLPFVKWYSFPPTASCHSWTRLSSSHSCLQILKNRSSLPFDSFHSLFFITAVTAEVPLASCHSWPRWNGDLSKEKITSVSSELTQLASCLPGQVKPAVRSLLSCHSCCSDLEWRMTAVSPHHHHQANPSIKCVR